MGRYVDEGGDPALVVGAGGPGVGEGEALVADWSSLFWMLWAFWRVEGGAVSSAVGKYVRSGLIKAL